MFSWITGPRITNVIEDLQPENNYESTFLEPPETPAHQFAVNAFKHALFGTPAPEDANHSSNNADKKVKADAANSRTISLPTPPEDPPPLSPSKQLGGILMTPGTASKGRKTVSFGSQVVDNEGKRGNIGKSGIPNDCPGKFPSPWTPGAELVLDHGSDKRPRTKLTEALLDARTTTQPKSGQKPKAKDDSDITIDLGAPRSESGKYWKEQYEHYAERSEKEMRKIIAKQQLAKKFAMKKDSEVTELTTKLEQERKKFRQRERELEQQNKDFQQNLQQAMASNTSAAIEVAALKARVAVLEQSASTRPSDFLSDKQSFQIFEDTGKEVVQPFHEPDDRVELSFAPSVSMGSSGKENNAPKPRRHPRLSVPEASMRPSVLSRLGTSEGESSIVLGRCPRPSTQSVEVSAGPQEPPIAVEQGSRSPLKSRKIEPTKENFLPKSPAAILPSSPLPMPSPGIDPWMDLHNESSIHQIDRMAMPNYSGKPFSRPEWEPAPKQHRASKSVSHTKDTTSLKPALPELQKSAISDTKANAASNRSRTTKVARHIDVRSNPTIASDRHCKTESKETSVHIPTKADTNSHHSPTDPKFDLSRITTHHAEGSAQVKKDRAEILPVDRKEQARRRLEERKKLRKNAPV
ncbi:spindle pole body formation-associated protein-domain-containing protein [Ampelomyces quisqualis]|uniref:Spindle pole body formation-associated protein-domain-containing protein n=1 Tax=Ampelomyces quisqualis TaxID=50730 RepID=A0A6A5QLD9_AMPQU|nr:spindle pole body formation-associated protein-domain-containing protein [Ampelomyces quisqualis]